MAWIPRNAVLYGLAPPHTGRWAIEQAIADARNVLGAGEARNRVKLAVERTVPLALLVHTLIITWYARHGHYPADIDDRRAAQPFTAASYRCRPPVRRTPRCQAAPDAPSGLL